MTGVEAVSNGMSAFRNPPVVYGHRTLSAICGVLGVLLVGIAYLVQAYGIGAMDQNAPEYRSVLSQLAAAAVGPLAAPPAGAAVCCAATVPACCAP